MMNLETPTREAPDLGVIHEQLQDLYRAEYPEGAPHLYEQLLPRLPDYIRALVRRKLDLIVQEETEGKHRSIYEQLFAALPSGIRSFIREKISSVFGEEAEGSRKSRGRFGRVDSFTDLTPEDKRALSVFLDPQVLRAHLDVGGDSALSNDHHTIAHTDTQPPIVAHKLISVASSNEHPERLERMGCVFFDVDGTKTIVDCTSHAHAGKYLEGMAEFLCKPPDAVRQWLSAKKLKSEAFSVAGDEFVVILRSDHEAVTKKTLDEFGRAVQEAMKVDEKLTNFVSFDDPDFVMEYGEWTDAERERYASDPGAMKTKFDESRNKLPDKFIPSVSSGSATFLEALDAALSPDTEEAKTLEELGINSFRGMVAKADERLKQDKRTFRENMTDPKWKAFLLRNSENRRLQNEIAELQFKYDQALKRIAYLEGLVARYEGEDSTW